jgi:hypothetical protein
MNAEFCTNCGQSHPLRACNKPGSANGGVCPRCGVAHSTERHTSGCRKPTAAGPVFSLCTFCGRTKQWCVGPRACPEAIEAARKIDEAARAGI